MLILFNFIHFFSKAPYTYIYQSVKVKYKLLFSLFISRGQFAVKGFSAGPKTLMPIRAGQLGWDHNGNSAAVCFFASKERQYICQT